MRIHPTNIEVTPRIGVELKIIPIMGDLDTDTFILQYIILDADGQIIKKDRIELTPDEIRAWNCTKQYLEDLVLRRLDLHREY